MSKKTILNKVSISAQVNIRIDKRDKLNNAEYSTIAKFAEAIPSMVREIEKKTAVTFLELLKDFHERERKGKKAIKKK